MEICRTVSLSGSALPSNDSLTLDANAYNTTDIPIPVKPPVKLCIAVSSFVFSARSSSIFARSSSGNLFATRNSLAFPLRFCTARAKYQNENPVNRTPNKFCSGVASSVGTP